MKMAAMPSMPLIAVHNAKDKQIIDETNKQHRIVITADLDFPQRLAETSNVSVKKSLLMP